MYILYEICWLIGLHRKIKFIHQIMSLSVWWCSVEFICFRQIVMLLANCFLTDIAPGTCQGFVD